MSPDQARRVDILWCDDHDARADWGGHPYCNTEIVMGCSTCADDPLPCKECDL